MKNLPLGIQTFRDIIEYNKLYVDKTRQIYKLLENQDKYFFLSRPRRFGKSLLISTLKEIFLGNKELFKGLWIYDKIEWKKHPVIHLDFSGISFETPEKFRNSFENRMNDLFEDNKISINKDRDYKEKFRDLLKKLSETGKVVILIDEYDKPLIEFIDKPDIALENRSILKNFYEVIKESDQYIRFAMLTGVSKFSRVSVFSCLNNLIDITLDEQFSTLLGYTEDELSNYFSEHIKTIADKIKLNTDLLRQEIKNWYNGYSWDGKNFVYNPFSILSLFYHKEFGNYWFTSGTPEFLIKMIRQYNIDIESLENYEADETLFDSFDINQMNVESLLFQTGYLTIKEIFLKSVTQKKYILNYPNLEVKESFLKNLLTNFANKPNLGVLVGKISEAIEKDNIELFFTHLISLFAMIPHHIFIENKEAYYHTIIYLILTLMGVRIKTEVNTNKGRIDAVVETEKQIYVMEFKLGSAEKALEQIETMKYYQPFLSSGKEITLVGIGFDVEERNVKSYLVKNLTHPLS